LKAVPRTLCRGSRASRSEQALGGYAWIGLRMAGLATGGPEEANEAALEIHRCRRDRYHTDDNSRPSLNPTVIAEPLATTLGGVPRHPHSTSHTQHIAIECIERVQAGVEMALGAAPAR